MFRDAKIESCFNRMDKNKNSELDVEEPPPEIAVMAFMPHQLIPGRFVSRMKVAGKLQFQRAGERALAPFFFRLLRAQHV